MNNKFLTIAGLAAMSAASDLSLQEQRKLAADIGHNTVAVIKNNMRNINENRNYINENRNFINDLYSEINSLK